MGKGTLTSTRAPGSEREVLLGRDRDARSVEDGGARRPPRGGRRRRDARRRRRRGRRRRRRRDRLWRLGLGGRRRRRPGRPDAEALAEGVALALGRAVGRAQAVLVVVLRVPALLGRLHGPERHGRLPRDLELASERRVFELEGLHGQPERRVLGVRAAARGAAGARVEVVEPADLVGGGLRPKPDHGPVALVHREAVLLAVDGRVHGRRAREVHGPARRVALRQLRRAVGELVVGQGLALDDGEAARPVAAAEAERARAGAGAALLPEEAADVVGHFLLCSAPGVSVIGPQQGALGGSRNNKHRTRHWRDAVCTREAAYARLYATKTTETA